MSMTWGNNIEMTLFGESHGPVVGIVLGNLPAGLTIDEDDLYFQMKRRQPGRSQLSTSRKESDQPRIVSGVYEGKTTGAPLCMIIQNEDQHSQDYSLLKECMRPGHCDYPAYMKYHGYHDIRGSGHFSGRLTAPLVFAGTIARQILKEKGIVIGSHILSIHDIIDHHFDVTINNQELEALQQSSFPLLNREVEESMKACILEAKSQGDSVGGVIECAITHVPAGIGNPFFDSMESHLSSLLFSIPGVKSVAFGDGEDICRLRGSQANDAYYYDEGNVKTKTNHNGGITGGISNGMPIVFRVGIKPTSSIALSQQTINVKTQENTQLELKGRHDPCIVPRAVVVVESMAALGLLDLVIQDERFKNM